MVAKDKALLAYSGENSQDFFFLVLVQFLKTMVIKKQKCTCLLTFSHMRACVRVCVHTHTHTNKTNNKQTKIPGSRTVQNGHELFRPLQLQAWLLCLSPDTAGLGRMCISCSFFVDSLSYASLGSLVSFQGTISVLNQLVFYLSCLTLYILLWLQ